MSDPKAFASLGPTLLARKGGARPAMRPQLAPMSTIGSAQMAEAIAHDLEDLGWNDMGTHETPAHDAQVLALTPAPSPQGGTPRDANVAPQAPGEPEVLRQRRTAAAELARAEAEPSPARTADTAAAPGDRPSASPSPRRPRRTAIEAGRRAAFTLRLDPDRHLKLRLASTVKNRSAQQLVTAALDRFLAEIPEIEALAAQVNRDRPDR